MRGWQWPWTARSSWGGPSDCRSAPAWGGERCHASKSSLLIFAEKSFYLLHLLISKSKYYVLFLIEFFKNIFLLHLLYKQRGNDFSRTIPAISGKAFLVQYVTLVQKQKRMLQMSWGKPAATVFRWYSFPNSLSSNWEHLLWSGR